MPEIVVLVKVTVNPTDVPSLKEYREKNVKALKKAVPGFRTFSVWKADNNPSHYLLAFVYTNSASADDGLKVTTEAGPLVAELHNVMQAPEVRRAIIEFSAGKALDKMPVGSLASVSFRISEPGMGANLVEELGRIFSELATIDGYLGSIACRNETLPEEAIGIVLWAHRAAFESSLPSKVFYEVSLYQRAF